MRGQRHARAALYPQERPGAQCTGGWIDTRAVLDRCGKSRPPPTGIWSPDRPARSQSLYRLRYLAHLLDGLQGSLVLFLPAVRVYLISKLSRPAVWPTQFPLHCVDGVISPTVERAGRRADSSDRSVRKLRIGRNVLPLHHVPSCRHVNNYTFTSNINVRL